MVATRAKEKGRSAYAWQPVNLRPIPAWPARFVAIPETPCDQGE
jgi:hypothetical protein